MRVGDQLAGRYRLDRRLGRGGMGEVWQAHDTALDRAVAVKVVLEAVASEEAVARFRREATIGARLQHPGITVVHDVGQEEEQLFIVMELLAGEDLEATLAREPGGLPVAVAVELVAQSAEALAAAHELGVVHRDLKPSNLFLLPGGRLKICDFGIAHSADATAGWTVTGRGGLGSPQYMAPEQWRGEHVDARSDLYALGGVLYALLSGDPPFGRTEGFWVLMRRHTEERPVPLREAGKQVPVELDRLVLRLLAKDPADRPESAVAVAATLRGLTRPTGGPPAGGSAWTEVGSPPGDGGRGGTAGTGTEAPDGPGRTGDGAGTGNGAGTEPGGGTGDGAGAGAGGGARAGAGAEPGAGAGAEPGAEPGAGAGAEPGAGDGVPGADGALDTYEDSDAYGVPGGTGAGAGGGAGDRVLGTYGTPSRYGVPGETGGGRGSVVVVEGGDGAGAGAGGGAPGANGTLGQYRVPGEVEGGRGAAFAAGAGAGAGAGGEAGDGVPGADGALDTHEDSDAYGVRGLSGVGREFLRDLLTEVEDTLLLLPADHVVRVELLSTAADAAARFDADLARRLLRDAEAAAWTAGRHDGARVARNLLQLAGNTAAHAPARSRRLLADAHQALFTVQDPTRTRLLREVAGKLLKVAPEEAHRISEYHFANSAEDRPLVDRIEKAAIASDPDRALQYLDSVTDPGRRAAETYEMVLALGMRDLTAALRLAERIGDAVGRLLVLCQLVEDLAAAKDRAGAARVLEQAEAALPLALSERASWLREEADRHAAAGRDVEAERLRGRAAALLRGRLEAAADEKAGHSAAALAKARERVVAPAPAQQDLGHAAERAHRGRSLPDAGERAVELLATAWTYAAGGGAPWLTAVSADPGTPLPSGTTVLFAPAGTGFRDPWRGNRVWSTDAVADELHAAGGLLARRSGTDVAFLNADTGTIHWTARADEGVSDAPPMPGHRRLRVTCVADAGTVYVEVSRTDGPGARLVAREPENGRVRWWRDLPERRPLHSVGPVLLHGMPGDLTALDSATGDVLWRRSLPDPGTRSLAAAGDCLLLKDSRLLQALHLPTGRTVWSWSVEPPANHVVYGDQDLGEDPVHFLDGPFLIALRRSTGGHLWRFDVGRAAEGLLIEGGTVYVAAYDAGRGEDRVVALDAMTGALRWQRAVTRQRGPECTLRLLGLRAGALYVDVRSGGRRGRFGRIADPFVAVLDAGTGRTWREWAHPEASDGETVLVGDRLVLSRPTLSAYALP